MKLVKGSLVLIALGIGAGILLQKIIDAKKKAQAPA